MCVPPNIPSDFKNLASLAGQTVFSFPSPAPFRARMRNPEKTGWFTRLGPKALFGKVDQTHEQAVVIELPLPWRSHELFCFVKDSAEARFTLLRGELYLELEARTLVGTQVRSNARANRHAHNM